MTLPSSPTPDDGGGELTALVRRLAEAPRNAPTGSWEGDLLKLEQFQALLRIAGRVARVGGWSVDLASGHVLWSDEVCAIHDMPPGTSPTLAEGLAYYPPRYRPVIETAFMACVQRGKPFDLELQIVTAMGRAVWVRSIGEAKCGPDGEVIGVHGAFQDISDRMAREEQNRRLADSLTNTLESITDAFFTLDSEWRFSFLNRQAERLVRHSRTELIGRTIWEAFPGTVGSTFERQYRQALASGETTVFEEFYAPLGAWFSIRAFPSEQGLAVYFRDITDARKAEDRAREAARLVVLRSDVATRLDTSAPIRSLAQGFCELLVQHLDVAFARIWTLDDTRRQLDAIALAESMPRSGPASGLHSFRSAVLERITRECTPYHTNDLSRYPEIADPDWAVREGLAAFAGFPLRVEGRVLGVLCMFARVPFSEQVLADLPPLADWLAQCIQRRRDDERLREQAALLDKAQDAILVGDLDHRILYWNRSAERLYGWSAREAVGRSHKELLHNDPVAFAAATEATLEMGEWMGEMSQTAHDGRVLTVEARWTLVRDDSGHPRSILSINTDITQRRRIEAQFLRAQRMESIGTLAGGIAHDLNNVLAPILMAIDLLKMDLERDQRLEILSTIELSARRGADMVSQVLSFARGVEGRKILVQVPCLVRDIVKIVNETFMKSITVRHHLPPDLWNLSADPTQLHQVLLNLSVNARDAMPDGGTLTFSAENVMIDDREAASNAEAQAGAHVLIQVEDTGTGIPSEIIDRIFDPFFTTKETGQGTGLGLSTSLAIVKGHRGFVRVYSEPGRGTRFCLYLPAKPESQTVRPIEDPHALPRGDGERVLVIDDEASVREVTCRTLQAFGYEVLAASNGAEAVALYAERRDEISVVLTDMMMPVMDGTATIQVLKKLNPEVLIIAASGLNADGRAAKAASAGARYFLPKPYSAESLLRMLREILSSR